MRKNEPVSSAVINVAWCRSGARSLTHDNARDAHKTEELLALGVLLFGDPYLPAVKLVHFFHGTCCRRGIRRVTRAEELRDDASGGGRLDKPVSLASASSALASSRLAKRLLSCLSVRE